MQIKTLKLYLILVALIFSINTNAQLTDGITGLLHMPNAETQKDATLMVGGNLLNKYNIPNKSYWGNYNTYNYFLNITILDRIEISYICTLVQGKSGSFWPEQTWGKFVNQDRHFAGKIQILKEGEWWKYMPSIALGVSDPTTGGGNEYFEMNVKGNTNGFFNKWYIALSKHFNSPHGELGIHTTYLYNKRTDYPLNGLALGLNFRPNFHKNINFIVEYDTKTINIGTIYKLWADHFNLLFELQKGKYISIGVTYKVNLKGNNKWKNNILD